jgi:hypothetical protein
MYCCVQANEIGGQFNMAKTIPGKEEFHETIRCCAASCCLLASLFSYVRLGPKWIKDPKLHFLKNKDVDELEARRRGCMAL